jgi:hypothetical protein
VQRDTELRGVKLKEEQGLHLLYPPTDEDYFPDGYVFDITRSPNLISRSDRAAPFAWANLARLEIRRCSKSCSGGCRTWSWRVRLSGCAHFIGGIKHMPVRFTPGKKSA